VLRRSVEIAAQSGHIEDFAFGYEQMEGRPHAMSAMGTEAEVARTSRNYCR
jgi:hypothetical protein